MATSTTPTLVICLLGAAVAVAALALPGSTDEPEPANAEAAGTPAIEIVDFSFAGTEIVAPGQQIEVTNADGAPHTVTAVDGAFDTGEIEASSTAGFTAPDRAGTYEYLCSIHPSMTGTFRVVE